MIVELTKGRTGKGAFIDTLNDKENILDIVYEEATRMNIKMRLDVAKMFNKINKIKIGTTFIKFYLHNSTITFSTLERNYER